MDRPYLAPEQIAQLSVLLAQYIATQRALYAPRSIQLTPQVRAPFAGFFSTTLLDQVRLVVLAEVRVSNPAFYPMLQAMGFTNLPDMAAMSAITFVDVVICHGALVDRTLFHELVHVEQYCQLGIEEFSRLYVRGFLDGGGYAGIPLEQSAYALDARFAGDPLASFSVADEVARWAAGRWF